MVLYCQRLHMQNIGLQIILLYFCHNKTEMETVVNIWTTILTTAKCAAKKFVEILMIPREPYRRWWSTVAQSKYKSFTSPVKYLNIYWMNYQEIFSWMHDFCFIR